MHNVISYKQVIPTSSINIIYTKNIYSRYIQYIVSNTSIAILRMPGSFPVLILIAVHNVLNLRHTPGCYRQNHLVINIYHLICKSKRLTWIVSRVISEVDTGQRLVGGERHAYQLQVLRRELVAGGVHGVDSVLRVTQNGAESLD